jgi:hypothetical protein
VFTALALSLVLGQPDKKQPAAPKLDPLIEKAATPDPKDSDLRKLMKERVRERAQYLVRVQEMIAIGRWDATFFSEVVKNEALLWENVAELLDQQADKVKCFEKRVEKFKEFEKFIAAGVDVGNQPPQNLNLAKAARLDAEIALLKLKGGAADPPKQVPEELIKNSIAQMNDLAAAIEAKDEAKIKTAVEKLKVTMQRVKDIKLPKEEDERLKMKYEEDLKAAASRLTKALSANPDALKYLSDLVPKK